MPRDRRGRPHLFPAGDREVRLLVLLSARILPRAEYNLIGGLSCVFYTNLNRNTVSQRIHYSAVVILYSMKGSVDTIRHTPTT